MSGRATSAGDDDLDPNGLIRECYRIRGIGAAECRTIFLDWLLAVPREADVRALILGLLERHAGTASVDHPMTAVLRDGLGPRGPRGRRGGRAGRLG